MIRPEINRPTEEIYLENFKRLFPPDNPHPSNSLEAMPWFEHQTKLPPAIRPLYQEILSLFDSHNADCITPESYHNGWHSIAFAVGVHKTIEKAVEGNDPLEIFQDLKKYNELNDTNLTIGHLKLGLLILAITHDTGDIIKEIDTNTSPSTIHFHQIHGANLYISRETEELSAEFTPTLIDEYLDKRQLSEDELANLPDIINLVTYLTPHTTFMATDKEAKQPFGLLTRFLDQISQASYNQLGIKSVLGLTREQFLERLIATPEFKLLFESHADEEHKDQDTIPEEIFWFISLISQIYPQNLLQNKFSVPDNIKNRGQDLLTILLSNIDENIFEVSPIFYADFVNIRGRQLTKQLLESKHGSLLPNQVMETKFEQIISLWNKPVDYIISEALSRYYSPTDKVHLNELTSDIQKMAKLYS